MTTVSTLLELPENVYFRMRKYVENHPELDVDRFVKEAIQARLAEADAPQIRPAFVERVRWLAFLGR